jgi:hypothetical protein
MHFKLELTMTESRKTRMMAYLWEDLDAKTSELKFGDHFINQDCTIDEAETNTKQYIYGTFSRQKHKYHQGRFVIHKIWDVSEYAAKEGKFHQHSKIDDTIRRRALTQRIGRSDFHSNLSAEDIIVRVNQELVRHGQTLPNVTLSTYQHKMACEVLTAIQDGNKIILAELCARFGKTIWSGVIASELETPLVIVASYVKTVFTSVTKDLTSFEQWKDLVHVDTQQDGWQDSISSSLEKGKQVIAYLSMCVGNKRQERIDWLFSRSEQRLLIVDEADFGVHQKGQTVPLLDAVKESDIVLLMTGTNSDRAASLWNVDKMVSVTYPELLVQKKLSQESVAANA